MRHQHIPLLEHFIRFTIGDIKVDREAKLDWTYVRLLLDAFIPCQEERLVSLDELFAKYDPRPVEQQLAEVEKQSSKKAKEWEQLLRQLMQADEPEREEIIGRIELINEERNALRQTDKQLMEKLDIRTRSRSVLQSKREELLKMLQNRQEMLEEGTWEKIGGKDKGSYVSSILGDASMCFGFSKIRLQASPINDIFDWMTQYHPDLLPPGDPFPAPPTPKQATLPEKKEAPPKPQTEFPGIPDKVTTSIRTFLAIRRPGYTLLSLLDRSQDGKRAWLALLTRKLHNHTVEHVSDVIIELEPHKYMTIRDVQDPPATQQSQDPQLPS